MLKRVMQDVLAVAGSLMLLATAAGASAAHAAPPRYRVVDLASFGGGAWADAITNRGEVAGASMSGDAFLWSRAAGLTTIEGAGSLLGVAAVSNTGQVVGGVRLGLSRDRAFSWTRRGGLVDLGELVAGLECTEAHDVNARGEVVGASCDAENYHAFLWTDRDGLRAIAELPSLAVAVNQRGQIVGQANVGGSAWHAFSWTAHGGMVDLGTLGASSWATDVSDNGHVVGWSTPAAGAPGHAFLWTKQGGMLDLGEGRATAVSDSGCVVGGASDGSRSFFWSPASGRIELGASGALSWPAALNARCLVVGGAEAAEYSPLHAFVWSVETGMIELGGLEGSTYSYATDINARGDIVGASDDANGVLHAVMWQRIRDE